MSQSHGAADFILFSVEKGHNPLRDDLATLCTKIILKEHGFTPIACRGCYKGQEENSFLVPVAARDLVTALCISYGQECFALLTTDRHGLRKVYFAYADGVEEFQGYLWEVSEERARACDGWTYRPDVGKYWTILPNDCTAMRDDSENRGLFPHGDGGQRAA